MKRIISILMILVMLLSLVGCEEDVSTDNNAADKGVSSTTSTEENANLIVTESAVNNDSNVTAEPVNENDFINDEVSATNNETKTPKVTNTAGTTATQKPTATATVKPTATQKPTATATVKPTATQKPTATATVKPTATNKPIATATMKPTSTKAPIVTATAKPTTTNTPKPSVSNIIKFGTYEQDNNTSNGKEEIEWIVLDKQDGKMFVVSKYAIDCQTFHGWQNFTWETCNLRSWLNDTFANNAFSDTEYSRILSVTVTAEDNPLNGNDAGNDTIDKIFLLSISEAEKYFASDNERKCALTSYVNENSGAYNFNGYTYWWLRSQGYDDNDAVYVTSDGSIQKAGGYAYDTGKAVRPAMWITIN